MDEGSKGWKDREGAHGKLHQTLSSKLQIDDLASAAPNLRKNLALFSPQQVELAKVLLEMNQSHLFEHWPEPGVEDDEKRAFFDQVARLNASYPGGLASYIKTARNFWQIRKLGRTHMRDLLLQQTSNSFNKISYDFSPLPHWVPSGEILTFADDNFIRYEEAGVREARKAAFVLVAGGLESVLATMVALPLESTTGTCFLQHYIESILALQETSCRLAQGEGPTEIPLAIMTSDDTHSRTLELLEKNAYFGMNLHKLAMDPNNKYRIQTKPHGHGDVHSLLYSSGLLKEWLGAGRKWVLFFQDTNGLLFKAIPASLGVSATNGYHVNSLAVPRKAKEAIGGITKLTHKDGRTMVINVEYNQLDPLLRATGNPDGDVNCETGYSPFPGNINQLILEVGPYLEELSKTGGAIKEFVNPKYKDSTKTAFKSSTRLECMMQDYPKTLPPSARVGFTVMDPWLAYAPVKNNPEDAAKVPKGNPYHSATSGEMAIYRANSLILRKAGVKVDDPVQAVFNGQEVDVWPRIVWKPKWGLTFSEVKSKVSGNCSITGKSTIALKGQSIYLEDLALDGALIIDAVDGAEVKVGGSVKNAGWTIESVDFKDTSVPEEVRIRGFRINKVEQLEKAYKEPGKYSVKP
ncbi:UNVERIFIED_CONTAM: UDP-sugar pyrophosphorylase [Sesamum calycinum]|uniref:UTP-monosaccharide-1-phosphate uridylyltransferase n=1 Tax=Sesamum calycinum TaxID=2727403 RepID=A0AAW2P685_9LAMI